jgi:hypothetical protein
MVMGAIEYTTREMKSTLIRALVVGLSLGLAGNCILNKSDFVYAADTFETITFFTSSKQNTGYGNVYAGRAVQGIEMVNNLPTIQGDSETFDDSIPQEREEDFSLIEFDETVGKPSPLRRGGRYVWELGKGFALDLLDDTKAVYGKPKNWLYLGLAGGSALALSTQDEKINDYFKKSSWVHHDLEDYLEEKYILGICLFGLDAGFIAYGKVRDDTRALECGKALLNAVIIDQLTCSGLKRVVRRKRPDDDSKHSFPSSHSSGAFTAASVISEMYDNRWYIVAPAYVAAGVVAMERIDTNSHWASDVFFGAAVGEIIGRVVAKKHQGDMERDTGFFLEPMMGRDSDTQGIIVTYRWNRDLLKSLKRDMRTYLK